jgi:Domain of Unknown Function (DUF349)
MKLFSRLFHKVPPTPPQSAGSAGLIVDAAVGADDEALRVAAALKLPDGRALRALAGLGGAPDDATPVPSAALQRAARIRLAHLIDTGSIDFTGICAEQGHESAMLAVAALCKDCARLPQALASIGDPALVAQVAVLNPSSRVRRLAAEAVQDPAQLKQLLKQVRSKDKNVYKIIKQKCDALNAEERRAAQIASDVDSLCASLERHGHRPYDPLYTAAFEHLDERWRCLTPAPSAAIAQRAEAAIDRCREVIAEHARQGAQQAARLAAQQTAREAQERALQAAEEAALAHAAAEVELQNESAALREAEEAARAAERAAQEQVFRQLAGLIRNANAALADGNTQRAAALRRAIEQKLLYATAPPLHFTRMLQQLDDRLNELKQWKDYAVAPKRTALIEEMQALVGSMEEPPVLADRIKSLQREWRTISQGIVSDAGEDWQRFHQASQAAYQPCRDYFDAQAALRKENLNERRVLLERLGAFEQTQTAEATDWPLLARVLREARQEWRRYIPVEREAGRAAQAQFDAALARLQARLEAWQERSAEHKRSLIKRAGHLLTLEDGREAIDAVKRLQSLWKETPPGPRDLDQRLWNEFRELCDAVYKKRQQAFAEYTAALEANKAQAVALCEEAERVAGLSGALLLEGAAKIPDWRSAFEALGEMPRAEARGLQSRFERALDLCEARVAGQRERDEEQLFVDLFEAARHIQSYRWAVAQNAEPFEREALRQAAEAFIASVQHWPKGGLQAIGDTLAAARSMTGADIEASEKALRTLCIRCEIHSESPTPPEDEALRREYQVQRLMRGMGQGSRADEGDWDALALEWIRGGAVAPATYEMLKARFMRCRAKRPAPVPRRAVFSLQGGADDHSHHDDRAGAKRPHGREGSTRASAR